jgi:radical SAM superfamily enzyme YgiQ (UPF0313 family)
MLVLLIQPEYKDSWAAPPLGLGYLAGSLQKAGEEVAFIDLTLTPMTDDNFKEFITDTKPDLIGISLMVRALPEVRKLITLINEVSDVPVVIGGPQVTIEPEFTLSYTRADYAVAGEGEQSMIELTKKANGRLIIKNRLIENLDDLPFPAWELMPPLRYKMNPVMTPIKRTPIAPIITTRGCPYSCSFCGGPLVWGKTFRKRSAKNIVDEIELLRDKFGVREIFISDDNFTLSKQHALNLCNEMITRKIDMPWACPNGIRVDTADEELLEKMHQAGCYLVGFGIESGNQKILDKAHKHLDLKLVKRAVDIARKNKIMTYGFFIMGLPGETKATIRETIDFAKKLKLDRAFWNILIPFPGTEIFKEYSKKKPDVDWANIDSATGMIAEGIDYEDLTGDDLVYWQRRALREFYLRPRLLLSVLSHMRLGSIKTLLNLSFFKKLVK